MSLCCELRSLCGGAQDDGRRGGSWVTGRSCMTAPVKRDTERVRVQIPTWGVKGRAVLACSLHGVDKATDVTCRLSPCESTPIHTHNAPSPTGTCASFPHDFSLATHARPRDVQRGCHTGRVDGRPKRLVDGVERQAQDDGQRNGLRRRSSSRDRPPSQDAESHVSAGAGGSSDGQGSVIPRSQQDTGAHGDRQVLQHGGV